jgi:hypothetical protein
MGWCPLHFHGEHELQAGQLVAMAPATPGRRTVFVFKLILHYHIAYWIVEGMLLSADRKYVVLQTKEY